MFIVNNKKSKDEKYFSSSHPLIMVNNFVYAFLVFVTCRSDRFIHIHTATPMRIMP